MNSKARIHAKTLLYKPQLDPSWAETNVSNIADQQKEKIYFDHRKSYFAHCFKLKTNTAKSKLANDDLKMRKNCRVSNTKCLLLVQHKNKSPRLRLLKPSLR